MFERLKVYTQNFLARRHNIGAGALHGLEADVLGDDGPSFVALTNYELEILDNEHAIAYAESLYATLPASIRESGGRANVHELMKCSNDELATYAEVLRIVESKQISATADGE